MTPTPPGDLYAVPDPLPPGAPGDPIWAERVAAPAGAIAWRVLYHSRSIHGHPIAVSGLIVAPDARPPTGGFPVVAFAHATTGLADVCAPSRNARVLAADAEAPATDFPIPPLWADGFAVAATDYEGLGTPGRHPYFVGGSEGRSVLDSVRAARALLGQAAGTPTLILGGSQGGHAALFAGELAPTYAPEIDLRGVVALAPGCELAGAAMLVVDDPRAVGLAVAIGAGFEAAYPDADLEAVLTPEAHARLEVVDRGSLEDIVEAFTMPLEDVVRFEQILQPPWPALLEENTPGRVATTAPIFIGQGEDDSIVTVELTDALVERLRTLGGRVTYRRYPGADHEGIAEAAASDVRSWVTELFRDPRTEEREVDPRRLLRRLRDSRGRRSVGIAAPARPTAAPRPTPRPTRMRRAVPDPAQ